MIGFIKKFILPKEVDFNEALLKQAQTSKKMVNDLYQACINQNKTAHDAIKETAQLAREQKSQNMAQLLDVFITPYDKESIYRMITQLDWITLSVKHFQLETEIYDIASLNEYGGIFKILLEMTVALEGGIAQLGAEKLKTIAGKTDSIHDMYDQLVELCARATADLLKHDDYKHIIQHKDILLQLKDIAKHIHVTANTLEDMTIKIV